MWYVGKVNYRMHIYVCTCVSSPNVALLPPLIQAPLKAKLSSSPMDACSTCKLVAQLLKGFIDNNKTEVHSVCVHTVVALAVYNHLQR